MKNEPPERNCDVVMKGGITSGVVYPLAIVELADEFRFKNIGGTSAGAIAAAVTAAAEYRRVTQKSAEGFRALAQLPDFLAGTTNGEPNLLNLFPPTKATRRLFALALAFLGKRHVALKALIALLPLLLVSPLLTLLAFLPALVVIVVLIREWGVLSHGAIGGLVAVALLLLIAGVLLLAAIVVIRALCFTLPRNDFGFSTGRRLGAGLPGISDWLYEELQTVAGRTATDPVLTFGDLWTAGTNALAEECRDDAELRSINLQMITTGLTHGRPYRLPFETQIFSFRPEELRRYFPDAVVNHLVEKGEKIDDVYYELPKGEDLPVVVAARMSLSFPVLFALVPLYAVDYTLPVPDGAEDRPRERCWFIDGGLSSNFPLNLFDTPFPRWPTVGIDLSTPNAVHPIDSDEEKNVWMVDNNAAGRANRWMRFPSSGVRAISGYVGAILDTIRNWRDNTQMSTPGFLDRVVHVNLSADEGGLNLNMEAAKIARLTKRGQVAGTRLRERFGVEGAGSEPLNWNSHRWTRYKISMALLQKAMRNFNDAFTAVDSPYPTYAHLVDRATDGDPKTGYWWHSNRIDYQRLTSAFRACAEEASRAPVDFDRESPRPKPELRISARL
jgi:predicted acylesterase/phospholipase RssA